MLRSVRKNEMNPMNLIAKPGGGEVPAEAGNEEVFSEILILISTSPRGPSRAVSGLPGWSSKRCSVIVTADGVGTARRNWCRRGSQDTGGASIDSPSTMKQ